MLFDGSASWCSLCWDSGRVITHRGPGQPCPRCEPEEDAAGVPCCPSAAGRCSQSPASAPTSGGSASDAARATGDRTRSFSRGRCASRRSTGRSPSRVGSSSPGSPRDPAPPDEPRGGRAHAAADGDAGVSARARWGDAFVIDDPQPQRPPAQGDVMSLETLDRLVELLKDAPQPSVVITTPWRPDRTDPRHPSCGCGRRWQSARSAAPSSAPGGCWWRG